jgi:hypothetical protein
MWQTVLENLIPLVFAIFTPVILLLVNKALQAMAKRWHLEGVLQYEDKVDELVLKGIKAVEQKSLSALKGDGDKTAGQAKLDEAMKFVNAQLVHMNLPEKASTELSMLIESKLFDGAKEKAALPAGEGA